MVEQAQTEMRFPPPEETAARVTELLDTQGWFAMRSAVLDEVVVVARSREALATLPARHADAVVYSTREVSELVDVAPADLRVLHAVKKLFGGSIQRTFEESRGPET